jgi:hypothetical protein
MTTPRFTGTVILAEPRKSYGVRLDDGRLVILSRHEANLTNYKLRVGDRLEMNVYQNGVRHPRYHGWHARLLNNSRHRKPIVPPPPYYALGPVIRVGVRMPVNAT